MACRSGTYPFGITRRCLRMRSFHNYGVLLTRNHLLLRIVSVQTLIVALTNLFHYGSTQVYTCVLILFAVFYMHNVMYWAGAVDSGGVPADCEVSSLAV